VILRIVLILGLIVIAGAGCGGTDGSAAGRTTVAAAFYPLAWAAGQIGGDTVDVTNVTPPGAEPHDVELSARDVERIRSADVVLYLGGGFQPGMETAVDGASGQVVDLRPDPKADDPHVWLDPIRFAGIARHVGEVLGRERQASRLAMRLRALDRDFRTGLADCERRDIVTSHAAFGYLAQRYGLTQIAITGISPETEPAPRQLEDVVDRVRRSGATTVFFEPLVSPDLAETVAREAGARTAVLNPLEGLTEDEIAGGEEYFTVMRENLSALRRGLGCR
jgi:zinc transport system substrate-binding protein